MATVLDIGLLRSFDVIFPALFLFVIVFAIMQKWKVVSENSAINAMIAVSTTFLVLLSDTAVQLLEFIVPWFTIAIIFFVLMLLVFMVFGVTQGDISKFVANDKGVGWVIVAVGIIIIIAGFGNVVGQNIGPYLDNNTTISDGTSSVATGDFNTNISATLFHPKVLGIFILFGVFIFAIALLTGPG